MATFLTNINLNGNEIQNVVIQNLATAPTSAKAGQIYYDTVKESLQVYTGTAWVDVGSGNIDRETLEQIVTNYLTEHLDDVLSENYYDKDDIDTKLSQDYYDKTAVDNKLSEEYYDKDEIDERLSAITTLNFLVVDSLPGDDQDEHTIYLVKKTDFDDAVDAPETNDVYEEYLWIDGKWELLGDTSVDLSGYAKLEDLPEVPVVKTITIAMGQTSGTVSIDEDQKVLSTLAQDSDGEVVLVDITISDQTVTASIASAYEKDITVNVTVL